MPDTSLLSLIDQPVCLNLSYLDSNSERKQFPVHKIAFTIGQRLQRDC